MIFAKIKYILRLAQKYEYVFLGIYRYCSKLKAQKQGRIYIKTTQKHVQ
ncbi:hypothetical protein [Helicobacter fennelliae]|uniref:Uncharacterized protein n=1 Tax=Helicobacter fennelliae MRY12-0050 TaxID=1325130 RepID=T1CYC5_9HELI|nr:hypothetical protein [Helicobacter fennelliae]GAD18920.1 hypothetical protein HFN_0051 [Helicobacter fennelliae MRY12-0050]